MKLKFIWKRKSHPFVNRGYFIICFMILLLLFSVYQGRVYDTFRNYGKSLIFFHIHFMSSVINQCARFCLVRCFFYKIKGLSISKRYSYLRKNVQWKNIISIIWQLMRILKKVNLNILDICFSFVSIIQIFNVFSLNYCLPL